MLKRIIRLFFYTYGYKLLMRRYLKDIGEHTYSSMNLFVEKTQNDCCSIIFKYQDPGIRNFHNLSIDKLREAIFICNQIEKEVDGYKVNEKLTVQYLRDMITPGAIVRSILKTYGYNFIVRKYLEDKNGISYASINVATDGFEDNRIILFIYHADEIQHVHTLSRKNLIEIVDVCNEIILQVQEMDNGC